ncbi:MAG: aminopeptidase P family protein [Bdellovibrionales bacterium]
MVKPSETCAEKLKALRDQMQRHGLDGYIVPRADEYQGEFVAPYAERLKWLTGFTGSGGMALVFQKKAFVLTDGRYLIQVKNQVDNAFFETGDYVKKPASQWLSENVSEGAVIGYDPFLFTPQQIKRLQKECGKKDANLKAINQNLIDVIWSDQPSPPNHPVSVFPEKIAGLSSKQKIKNVVSELIACNAQAFIFSLPDSIAWLLNIRSSDIEYIPLALSYLLISRRGNVRWFIDPERVGKDVRKSLGKNVMICAPNDMGLQFMALAQTSLEGERPVLIDSRYTPVQIQSMLELRGADVKDHIDPAIAPKACKTKTEIEAIRKAHIQDGIALIKFLKWLEENGEGHTETEISDQLKSFRTQSSAFRGNSFPTIAGYGSNGAIVHYRAEEETAETLKAGNLLLIDSGGQYADNDTYGTTDITRTIAIGEPTQAMRDHNTLVLKGHIALAKAKFPKGTTGAQIDTLARKALWDHGYDFAHGTGHGVGCYLSVHEEAANISSRGQTAFEPGMLLSNEPGYYEEGQYGIRIENLIHVIEHETMLSFETISFAPLDKALINASLLNQDEIEWVNQYHQDVFNNLADYLDESLTAWLKDKTSEL